MDDQDGIRLIAYREELLKKKRLTAEERFWLISHPCFHQALGFPYLLADVLEFPAHTACLFSVAIEKGDTLSAVSPCFLAVGKKGYMVSQSAVADRIGQISIGKKLRSLGIHPASAVSRFLAFSEWGKLRVQYECSMLDDLGRELRIACSRSSWLAMMKTQINEHCIRYDCATPDHVQEKRKAIREEHRAFLPGDLEFGHFSFTVSWESNTL